jgi:hypothetical protein
VNARREWLDAALGRYVLANPQQAADTVTVVQFMRWLSTERVQCPAKARSGQLCEREEGHKGLHEWSADSGRVYTEPPMPKHATLSRVRDYFDKRPEIRVAGLSAPRHTIFCTAWEFPGAVCDCPAGRAGSR